VHGPPNGWLVRCIDTASVDESVGFAPGRQTVGGVVSVGGRVGVGRLLAVGGMVSVGGRVGVSSFHCDLAGRSVGGMVRWPHALEWASSSECECG
jgi:hypothetical protein